MTIHKFSHEPTRETTAKSWMLCDVSPVVTNRLVNIHNASLIVTRDDKFFALGCL
jgi:hypothetical protein